MDTTTKVTPPKMSKIETTLIVSIYGISFIGFCVAAVSFVLHLLR